MIAKNLPVFMTLSSLIAHQNWRDDHPIAAFLKPRAASIGALQLVILSRAAKPGAKDLNQARSAYLLCHAHRKIGAPQTGAPDKPGFGLVGWQPVILNSRFLLRE